MGEGRHEINCQNLITLSSLANVPRNPDCRDLRSPISHLGYRLTVSLRVPTDWPSSMISTV